MNEKAYKLLRYVKVHSSSGIPPSMFMSLTLLHIINRNMSKIDMNPCYIMAKFNKINMKDNIFNIKKKKR